MGLYRKVPVVVEARRFERSLTQKDAMALAEWCGGRFGILPGQEHIITITTLEGTMVANHGDWIIKGVKGEFYPCKHDIFMQTYEIYAEHV